MKFQVFIRAFGAPIVFAALVLIALETGTTSFKLFVRIAFFASVLFSALLSENRYIQNFTIRNDGIIINYLTVFLASRTLELKLKEISEVKLSKQSRIAILLPKLNLKTDKEWMRFHIPTKEIHNDIQNQLTLANLGSYTRDLTASRL